jgi:hypothetical protein
LIKSEKLKNFLLEREASMVNAITVTTFVQPHWIEALGEDGLSVAEIAISLKAKPKNIRQKIQRTFLNHCKLSSQWHIAEFSAANEINGLEFQEYVLNTRAAKVFIATYRNEIGASYLDFLFDCEKVATELMPKLIADNKILTEKLGAAENALITASEKKQKQLGKSKKGMLSVPCYEQGQLFERIDCVVRMKHIDDMTEMERLDAKIHHGTKVAEGLLNGISKLQDQKIIVQLKIENEKLEYKNNILKLVNKI